MNHCVLSTAFLPPVSWFAAIFAADTIEIEAHEHYIKQSYRNRCCIYTAGGRFTLSVPVIKTFGNHTPVKDVRISYDTAWQRNHWRTIESAYNKSAFFIYYRDALLPFFTHRFDFLFDFNLELIRLLLHLTGIPDRIKITGSWKKDYDGFTDLRDLNPKHKQVVTGHITFPDYFQAFQSVHGFIPDLSVIDLLFSEGPHTAGYIGDITRQPGFRY